MRGSCRSSGLRQSPTLPPEGWSSMSVRRHAASARHARPSPPCSAYRPMDASTCGSMDPPVMSTAPFSRTERSCDSLRGWRISWKDIWSLVNRCARMDGEPQRSMARPSRFKRSGQPRLQRRHPRSRREKAQPRQPYRARASVGGFGAPWGRERAIRCRYGPRQSMPLWRM